MSVGVGIMNKNEKTGVPALDDVDMRKKNSERVISSVEDIGSFFRANAQMQKWNLIVNAIWIVGLIVLFAVVYGYGISRGGIDALVDRGELTRRINCTGVDNHTSDIIRKYEDAETFTKLFGGTCRLYFVGG
jgi:hypothetical protein